MFADETFTDCKNKIYFRLINLTANNMNIILRKRTYNKLRVD